MPGAQAGARLAPRFARRTRPGPSDGVSSVARIASSVDLPAPFGPSRPTMSPALAVESDLRERLAAAEVPPEI